MNEIELDIQRSLGRIEQKVDNLHEAHRDTYKELTLVRERTEHLERREKYVYGLIVGGITAFPVILRAIHFFQ